MASAESHNQFRRLRLINKMSKFSVGSNRRIPRRTMLQRGKSMKQSKLSKSPAISADFFGSFMDCVVLWSSGCYGMVIAAGGRGLRNEWGGLEMLYVACRSVCGT